MMALLTGCTGGDEEKRRLVAPEQLHGQWRNVYLKLEMNSYRNSDSTRVFEVSEEDWEARMGIRPIRTFYWADGTFNSLHYNLDDSLVFSPSGKWWLEKDSLVMLDTFPARGAVYKYQVRLYDGIAEFSGIEDSDGDGKKDDLYYGTQRRYGK
jgi:hypothetical protein